MKHYATMCHCAWFTCLVGCGISFWIMPFSSGHLQQNPLSKTIHRRTRRNSDPYDNRQILDPATVSVQQSWVLSYVFLEVNSSDGKTHVRCGGTLLDKQHVLTAAHCFAAHGREDEESDLLSPEAKVFVNSLKDDQTSFYEVNVAKVFIHFTFEALSVEYNDVALVLLKEELNVTNVQFAKLADTSDNMIQYEGNCVTVGVGMTDTEEWLRYANKLTVYDKATCMKDPSELSRKKFHKYFYASKMCLTVTSNGQSVCAGDSGGPIFCSVDGDSSKQMKQFGIIESTAHSDSQTTQSCVAEGEAVLLGSVRHYRDWISYVAINMLDYSNFPLQMAKIANIQKSCESEIGKISYDRGLRNTIFKTRRFFKTPMTSYLKKKTETFRLNFLCRAYIAYMVCKETKPAPSRCTDVLPLFLIDNFAECNFHNIQCYLEHKDCYVECSASTIFIRLSLYLLVLVAFALQLTL